MGHVDAPSYRHSTVSSAGRIRTTYYVNSQHGSLRLARSGSQRSRASWMHLFKFCCTTSNRTTALRLCAMTGTRTRTCSFQTPTSDQGRVTLSRRMIASSSTPHSPPTTFFLRRYVCLSCCLSVAPNLFVLGSRLLSHPLLRGERSPVQDCSPGHHG